jgi:RNA polymerase sigma-70 factor (family 1)
MAFPNDAALNARLTQLRETDPDAFIEQLFRTFYAPLFDVAYRVLPDRDALEDILQDVFFRVCQGLDTLPAIDSYRAYLTRMALHAAMRYQERAQRQVAWDEAPPFPTPLAADTLNELHATDAAAAVAAALTKLPPQCRIIFELSRYEELSYQQIAEAMELSPKTVENQMGKALRILRLELAGVLKNLYGLLLCLLAVQGGPGPTTALPPPLSPAASSIFFNPGVGGSSQLKYLY